MLLLHNLTRFAFTRSPSSLWLAICEALLMASSVLFLNLLGPWLPKWHGMQTPGAYLALLLTAPCGLMFTYTFFASRGAAPAAQTAVAGHPDHRPGRPVAAVYRQPAAEPHHLRPGRAGKPEHPGRLGLPLAKGLQAGALFVMAMVIFNIGTLVILPALLGLTLIAPQGTGAGLMLCGVYQRLADELGPERAQPQHHRGRSSASAASWRPATPRSMPRPSSWPRSATKSAPP
jgi:two-component system, sensor histidine kinase RetS